MMSDILIQTEQLSKRYGTQLALNQLSLSVQRGEIFGYLGPNGAGKTTTIRILMDLIRPTQGKASIFGLNTQADSVALHRRIGFMPGELNLWPNQLGRNIVRYMAKVRGNVDMRYVGELTERLQIDLDKRMRDYSTGNKRKLGLLLALMHKPDLLILDEPTSGLDPLMQQIFNDLMRECREAGRTVFLSSHVLSEVQAICDRVGILRGGELKAVETVSKLTHAEFRWVTIEFRDRPLMSNLATISGVQDVTVTDHTVKLRLFGDFDPLLRALSDQYVVDLKINEPNLEEIFLAFYGEQRQLV